MPANKQAVHRYQALYDCMNSSYFPNMQTLRDVVSNRTGQRVCVSTVQKDIQALKREGVLGVKLDIGYSRWKMGYYIKGEVRLPFEGKQPIAHEMLQVFSREVASLSKELEEVKLKMVVYQSQAHHYRSKHMRNRRVRLATLRKELRAVKNKLAYYQRRAYGGSTEEFDLAGFTGYKVAAVVKSGRVISVVVRKGGTIVYTQLASGSFANALDLVRDRLKELSKVSDGKGT